MDECVFRREGICEMDFCNLNLLSYEGECFVGHTLACLNEWEKIKPKYGKALARVLNLSRSDADKVVSTAVALHDVGKLAVPYQKALISDEYRGLKADFRHELVSAYVVHEALKPCGFVALISAGATMLHHEPILLGQIVRAGERAITVTDLRRRFLATLRRLGASSMEFADGSAGVVSSICERINVAIELPASVEVSEIVSVLRRVIERLRNVGTPEFRNQIRLRVAALQHVIVLCDYRSAGLRGHTDERFFAKLMREGGRGAA